MDPPPPRNYIDSPVHGRTDAETSEPVFKIEREDQLRRTPDPKPDPEPPHGP